MKYELDYQIFLAKKLKKKHNQVYMEVPFKHKKIDIVFFDKNKISTIELKRNKNLSVIDQACKNLLFSDYSFIAFPSKIIDEYLINYVRKYPLGLIEIDEKSYNVKLHCPEINKYLIQKYQEKFYSNLVSGVCIEL